MSGKKPWPHPKGWIGKVVRDLHHREGGETDGAQNIILMMKMEEKLNPINLKTWVSRTVSGCLEARVGRNKVQLVP